MLVAAAVVGFLAAGDPEVPDRIIDALSLEGDAAQTIRTAVETAQNSRQAASVLGVAGLFWSGLGVTNALALAVRTPWQFKAAGLKTRLDGVIWLVGGIVLFGGAIALGSTLNFLPDAVPKPLVSIGVIGAGLAVELAFFLWTFWILGDRRLPWRALLPGAVLGAIGFEILKLIGTVYVPNLVAKSSSLYGPLGVVFAILAWLAIFARLIVYASTLNVVAHEASTGTLTVEVQVPKVEADVPVEANRGGTVVARSPNPPD